jgi:hypothetical protein
VQEVAQMDDGKDKYRKDKFTPISNSPCENPRSLYYLEWCKSKLDLYPDSENKLEKLLVDLAGKGADLQIIISNLQKPRSAETRQKIQGPALREDFKKHQGHLKTERAIRNAFGLLEKRIKPVLWEYEQADDINSAVQTFQKALQEFKPTLDEYLDNLLVQTCQRELSKETGLKFTSLGGTITKEEKLTHRIPGSPFPRTEKRNLKDIFKLCPPSDIRVWIKEKRELTSKTRGVWSDPICSIIDEIARIGYADNSSYEITAQLLKLQYQDIFTDDLELVKDQVKQRHKYKKRRDNHPSP